MKHLIKTMAFTLLGLMLSVNLMAAEKITTVAGITSGNKYYIGATNSSTDYYFYVDGSSKTESIKGVAKEDVADAVALTFTAVTDGWTIQFDNGLYLGIKNAKDNGAVQIMEAPVVWTIDEDTDKGLLKLHPNDYYLQKNNSGTQFGSYKNTQTNVWLESAGAAPDPTTPSLSVSPTTIDFGTVYQNATVDAEDVTVTFANLTTNDVAAAISGSAFSIDKTGSFTSGDKITITPSTADLDEYEETLTLSATGVDDQTVTIKMNVVEAPAPTGTFNKFTGDNLKEGDYVICDGTDAMNNTTKDGPRIGYQTTTVSNNKIDNPDKAVIWHISADENNDGYWLMYNEAAKKYAAFTSSDGKGTLLDAVTDYARWQSSKTTGKETYEFTNKGKTGKYLRKNGTYGFASYGTGTGGALTLYKKYVEPAHSAVTFATCENGSVGAQVKGAAITSGTTVDEDEVVTLTNTPATGYKLDAYKVYKTGDESTTVSVKDGKFTMPAYAVTVSATFSLSIETPVLSEEAGDKNDAINVKVTNYNGDYFYYYTLDGTEPSNASTPYVDADGIAINASCTLKVIAYKGEVTSSVAWAAYNLPLMTMDAIFASATTAGKTATDVRVKFTNCVITGVKNNNAYLTDNDGKGLIIFQSSHGFEVNDKLNGAVNVKVQLYNGSAELTELTSSTSGLTVTKDGSVSPITTIGIASLSGVNTGAVLSYENLTYDDEYFSDGTNGIKPYNNFNIEDYPTFENGDKYNVTGVYIQFSSTKEIAPRSLADLEKIEATKYAINLATVEHGTIATDPETEAADGVKVTLSATPETGYMLSAWSVVDAESNLVEVINNQFTMPAKEVTVSATFDELSKWAYVYTSNVIWSVSDKFTVGDDDTEYCGKKDGTSSAGANVTFKVPAKSNALHFHIAGWGGDNNIEATVKQGSDELGKFSVVADEGITSSGYVIKNNPATQEYFYLPLSNINQETTISITTTAGKKRIFVYGVNYVAPAEITLDEANEYDFDEVKENASANKTMIFTVNDFADVDNLAISFTGEDAGMFTAGNITATENDKEYQVEVTFTPGKVQESIDVTMEITDGEATASHALSGKGITATTPEIVVSDDEIDFGKVKQDATIADQTVTVTLNYLDAATASIDDDTYFSIDKTNLETGDIITISAKATSTGVKSAIITITGTGATTKTIAVKMDVVSKWAGDYNTDACITMSSSQNAKVKIDGEEYPAVKANDAANATITLPEGVTNLYFHAAAWNGESVTLTAYKGTTIEEGNKLGEFTLVPDGGVKSSSPYILVGENYDTDQYFHIDGLTDITEGQVITFVPNDNRYVIYGVHQEGGIVPVLDHLAFDGSATRTEYEVGDEFDPSGLTVNAIYKLEGVDQEPVDVTEDVEWEFTPSTLTEGSYDVNVKAIYENKEISTTVAINVTAATAEITVNPASINFGTVAQDATIDAQTVAVTLKAIANATVAVTGDASAFNVTPASLTESGDITITPVTTNPGEFKATITISADGAESKTVALSMTVAASTTYTLVTDVNQLAAGDIVVMGVTYTKDLMTYNYVNGDLSGDYLVSVEASVDGSTISAAGACEFTLAGGAGSWTLSSANGTLGAINAKKLTYDDTKDNFVNTWTISITDGNVTIASTKQDGGTDNKGYGRFLWNYNNGNYPRFLTYTSNTSAQMLLPQLYKKEQASEVVRTDLTSGKYGTICLNKAVTSATGAEFYKVVGFQGEQTNPTGIVIESVETLEAGVPYIFLAKGSEIKVTYEGVAENEADEANGLIGSFETKDLEGDNIYGIKDNALRKLHENGNQVGANRAYINMSEMISAENAPAAAPGAHRVAMSNSSYSAPTNFNGLNGNAKAQKVMKNGQFYIIREAKMYNAQGIEVQ